jgi:hypothetical protein
MLYLQLHNLLMLDRYQFDQSRDSACLAGITAPLVNVFQTYFQTYPRYLSFDFNLFVERKVQD